MPRKDNRKNPLDMEIEPVSLPLSMIPLPTDSSEKQRKKMERYWQMLLDVARNRGVMHPKANVILHWINSESKGQSGEWDQDQFEDAVAESTEGFNQILAEGIEYELEKYRR